MTSFEIYVFVLCFIVFTALTALFSFLIATLIRLTVRLVRAGVEDERITKEYAQTQRRGCGGCLPVVVDRIISGVLCCVLFVAFIFSLCVNFAGAPISDTVPTLGVVKSGSMAYKNEKNDYLFQNFLNDQFRTFDLVLLYKLPAEEDLKLYDVVLYEVEGTPVIHRIVGIEAPNEKHEDYYFLLQGDALENPDRFPVYYHQMRGIYRGERIPFVGSFVAFMQSVAGYLCILLVIFGIVAIPIVEKKVNAAKRERLIEIGVISADSSAPSAPTEDEPVEDKPAEEQNGGTTA